MGGSTGETDSRSVRRERGDGLNWVERFFLRWVDPEPRQEELERQLQPVVLNLERPEPAPSETPESRPPKPPPRRRKPRTPWGSRFAPRRFGR